jgi:hypothetical protein
MRKVLITAARAHDGRMSKLFSDFKRSSSARVASGALDCGLDDVGPNGFHVLACQQLLKWKICHCDRVV